MKTHRKSLLTLLAIFSIAVLFLPVKATAQQTGITRTDLQRHNMRNIKMEINYGVGRFKFGQAVMVDSEVKLKAKLKSIANLREVTKVVIEATLVIKDQLKPAYKGDVV